MKKRISLMCLSLASIICLSGCNKAENIGEIMKSAALNTLLGMGTVFIVLILMAFIISLFGIIPKIEKSIAEKKEKKAASKNANVEESFDNTIAQIIEKEEDELSDDLELVAVISAAIAAYEGSGSAEGYVVRSIKKSRKWHNA